MLRTRAYDEKGAAAAWFVIALNGLVMLYLYMYLHISMLDTTRQMLKDKADLAATAGATQIDYSSFFVPGSDGEIEPRFDEASAVDVALDSIEANMRGSSYPGFKDAAERIFKPDGTVYLEIDPLTGLPLYSNKEGVSARILKEGVDVDPFTGATATKDKVCVIIQCKFSHLGIDTVMMAVSEASL